MKTESGSESVMGPWRHYEAAMLMAMVSTVPLGFTIVGLAASPGIYIMLQLARVTHAWQTYKRAIILAASLGIGVLAWCCITLIMIGFVGMLTRPQFREGKVPHRSYHTILGVADIVASSCDTSTSLDAPVTICERLLSDDGLHGR